MSFGDTLRLALRNLGQAKLRTTLTAMGVSIGIASLAGMVSLGVGLQEQVVGRLAKSGVFDAITVTQAQPRARRAGRGLHIGGRATGPGGARGGGRGAETTPAPPDKPPPVLNDEAIAAMTALSGVKEVYPNIRVPSQVKFEDYTESAMVAGVSMSSKNEGVFQAFAAGGFFASDTDKSCLMTLDFARRFSDRAPKELVGQPLTISYATRPAAGTAAAVPSSDLGAILGGATRLPVQRATATCTVAGIIERDPQAGMFGGGLIFGLMIPLNQARAINLVAIGGQRSYAAVTVKVHQPQAVQEIEDKIKAQGYNAFSLNDLLRGFKRAFLILDIVLGLIGSIALAVSSLGIVNTMVMSILERTREIGIMKAIGGSDGDIRRIFLIEASAIGLLGGVAGVTLGFLVGRVINFGANMYIQSQGGPTGNLFSLPLWLIAGAIGFSVFVSLVAGSYPARRAAKLDPIRALRHD